MTRLLLPVLIPVLVLAQNYDLLIRNGFVLDGTGNPGFYGDVAIREGRIAAVNRTGNTPAKRTIDAKGLIVAPGFIDIHNHSDAPILVDGNAESMVHQGVTSMIFGEGGSAAPIGGKQPANATSNFDIARSQAQWTDFAGYFAEVRKRGVSTNIGSYVGSSQIWTYVHGAEAGPPTPYQSANSASTRSRIGLTCSMLWWR